MRRLLLLLALLPSTSVAQAPSRAPPSPETQAAVHNAMEAMNQAAAEVEASIDNDPCLRREGGTIRFVGYRNCVAFLPPERMRGVWYPGLEQSEFMPGATTAPAARYIATDTIPPESETWLDIDLDAAQAALAAAGPEPQGPGGLAVAIEFIGRRARAEGRFGHGGMARRLIVVDRIISARPLRRVRTWIEDPRCTESCGRD